MDGVLTVHQYPTSDLPAEYRETKIQLHLRDEIPVPQTVGKACGPVGMDIDIPGVITGAYALSRVLPMVDIGVERDTKFCASVDASIGPAGAWVLRKEWP